MTRLPINLVIAGVALLTAVWHQSTQADDLLRLVDGNSAACLHVRNLKSSIMTLEDSAFAERLRKSAMYEEFLKSPEFAVLRTIAPTISSFSGDPGATPRETIENFLGREFLVSVSLTTGAPPSGLVLVSAPESVLTSAVDGWRRIDNQQRSELTFEGKTYFASSPAGGRGGPSVWYAILDEVLAVSSNEAQIKRVIELSGTKNSRESLSGNADFEPASWRREKDELVSVYVNPRAFDSFLWGEDEVPSLVRAAWKRCRWLTLRGLAKNDELQFQLIADYDSSGAPEWWSRQVSLQNQQKLPLDRVPESSLLTLSGHVSSEGIRDLISHAAAEDGSLPKDVKQVRRVLAGLLLGSDPLEDLLPSLGPRWLFYSVPRQPAANATFPIDGAFAIELKSGSRSPSKAGLENALNAGLNALAAVHNAKTEGDISVIRQKSVDGTTIHWADPVTTFRPAFAVTDNFLVLATTPEVCEAFLETPDQGPEPSSHGEKGFSENNQLLLANPAATREFLKTHSQWFVTRAQRDNVPEAEATRRLAELKDALSLIDTAWFSVSGDSDTLTATIGVSVED